MVRDKDIKTKNKTRRETRQMEKRGRDICYRWRGGGGA